MKNLLLLALILAMGCTKTELEDPASRVAGDYKVNLYVIDRDIAVGVKDTLVSFRSRTIPPNLPTRISVARNDDGTVSIMFFADNGNGCGIGLPSVRVETDETNRRYKLTAPDNTIDTYFGYTDGNTFYTTGAGWNPQTDKRIRTIVVGQR